MSSDIAQTTALTGAAPVKGIDIELTREEGFLSGSHDIFDLLQPKDKPKLHNATDLLKAAYNMLEQAERTIANQNKRIESLEGILTTDELTKLSNRRGFYESFKREVDRTNRGQSEGGLLVMIDLDNFKTINDTYGHQAGDAALRLVAEFLKSEIRDMDVAARLGGDEFILIFPNASKEKAMKRAQMMGMRMNNLSLIWGGKEIRLGGSIGLKDYAQGDTIESIIRDADQGMYENKKARKEGRKA